jgi:hypothetical protein
VKRFQSRCLLVVYLEAVKLSAFGGVVIPVLSQLILGTSKVFYDFMILWFHLNLELNVICLNAFYD